MKLLKHPTARKEVILDMFGEITGKHNTKRLICVICLLSAIGGFVYKGSKDLTEDGKITGSRQSKN